MNEEYLGYIKYKGKLVESGLLDARKAAQALIGFDEAVRFFVGQQSPSLTDIDFEFPVRIREGSWAALIPHNLIDWIMTAVGVGTTTYLITAAKKMAERDFSEKGLKDIFIHAVEAIQWMIRIGRHLGNLTIKKFENVRFRSENTEIGIPNENKEYLFVPKKYFDFFLSANPKLLNKIAELIEEERELEIGVYKEGEVIKESVPHKYKYIFASDEEEEVEDMLFPELKHGQTVALEGHITRGNENTNTLGLKYKDHILTCYPHSGSIVRFKNTLFLYCRIYGIISRLDKFGGHNELKPKIVFDRIEPLEPDNEFFLFSR